MKDPYKVLGVSPTASDDEIKTAYRNLARKYHPDKYAGSDLAELAEEKMKEVNSAYEEIQRMRANSGNSSGSYNGGGNGFSGFGVGNDGGGGIYNEIRLAINIGDTLRAQTLLDSVSPGDRGAEWNFLSGCVALRRGYYTDAQRFIDIACSMDPTNQEYLKARDALRSRTAGYGGGYTTGGNNGCACSGCDVCTGLMCADCCCECMGGDLIRCC